MRNVILTIIIPLISHIAYGYSGAEICIDKKNFLRNICQSERLKQNVIQFSKCANGFSYRISTKKINVESDLVTTETQCKMVEIRKQNGIETRTTYLDKVNNKVVVYQHDNGLANAYVYGYTGYYHITQFASGDSIYNFHSFEATP